MLAELLELAPGGVEEVNEPDGRAGVVEYAIYGAPGELPELGELQAAAGGALVEVRSEPLADDWEQRWKRFYQPLLVAGRVYVRPPWERPAERGGVAEVVIDPGRAFGTGTHATTAHVPGAAGRGGAARPAAVAGAARAPALVLRPRLRLGRARDRRRQARLRAGAGRRLRAGGDSRRATATQGSTTSSWSFGASTCGESRRRSPTSSTANLTTELLKQVARALGRVGGARPRSLIASGFLTDEAGQVTEALDARRPATSEPTPRAWRVGRDAARSA